MKPINITEILLLPLLSLLALLLSGERVQARLMANGGGRQLTLQQVIEQALQHSAAAKQAATTLENSYWQWKTFKSNYKPQLGLEGVLPDFSRTFTPVTQPDGTTEFRAVSMNSTALNLTLSQSIGLTGGEIFLNSQTNRFDDFDRNQRRYNSNPVLIGLHQPILGFNKLAWDKKIEPLRYEESQKKYLEDLETISAIATEYFFDQLLQQVNLDIATKNFANAETILKLAEEKHRLGRISRNDLLQLQLILNNTRLARAQAGLDLKMAALKLRTYIGLTDAGPVELVIPANIPDLHVDEQTALAQARQNRKEQLFFRRQQLLAEREVAYARGTTGFQASLFATFGLTNRGETFLDSYVRPENQQQVRVGFSIPLLDWGRQQAIIKTAQSDQKLVNYTVEQDVVRFEQAVVTQVNQFALLKEQLAITAESDEIAQDRFEITKASYLIGKISITDLNISLVEKDQARRAYIASLREFWIAYYNLRALTLYDFEHNQAITYKE